MFTELRTLRVELLASENRRAILERDNVELVERLKRAPAALISQRLSDLNGLRRLFDLLRDPVVVTTSEHGGTIVYCNTAFARGLGYTADEIVAKGWRALIHPADLIETETVETQTWDSPVWGFVNRYVHANGMPIWCRWYCQMYSGGMTIAIVQMSDPALLSARGQNQTSEH